MNVRAFAVCALAAHALLGCQRSVAGNAVGRCSVRYGGFSPGPDIPGGERTEAAEIRIEDVSRDEVRVTVAGCDLRGKRQPPAPHTNPRFLFTGGRCRLDVPTLGARDFAVANRRPDPNVTESVGDEAYMNVTSLGEVFLVLEAFVEKGRARVSCEGSRRGA
jgi:hypothetical protein